jgi:hypothetical protein
MAPRTNPSITALMKSSTFEAAFQANTGDLWISGSAGTRDENLKMWPGTSPSIHIDGISSLSSLYEVAFQGTNGGLWLQGSFATGDQHLAMKAGTSPAVTFTEFPSFGYEAAYQGTNGDLWLAGTAASGDTSDPMADNPAIAFLFNGSYQAIVQVPPSGALFSRRSVAGGPQSGMFLMAGTSPSFAD